LWLFEFLEKNFGGLKTNAWAPGSGFDAAGGDVSVSAGGPMNFFETTEASKVDAPTAREVLSDACEEELEDPLALGLVSDEAMGEGRGVGAVVHSGFSKSASW